MEEGFISSKGVIERVKGTVYQFDPKSTLEKLDISTKELNYSFGGLLSWANMMQIKLEHNQLKQKL